MNNGTILIVDDDQLQRSTLSVIFSEEGYHVECVNSGGECLERIQHAPLPDLVLLDLGLPDMEGTETLREIRKTHRSYQIPVIINSGESDTDRIVEALESGANDFIMKPADTNVFLARIKVCMKVSQGTRELLDLTRHQVMHESIGAACHHVAQPMTALQTGLELYLREIPHHLSCERAKMQELLHWAREATDTIHKLQNVHAYKTVKYYGESKILDIQPDADEILVGPSTEA